MLIINPGTHGDDSWTLEQAEKNLRELISKVVSPPVTIVRSPSKDGGGRYAFTLTTDLGSCSAESPGCPQNDLHWGTATVCPVRYYIDGNSWQFDFAIGGVERALNDLVDDD